LEPVKDDLSLDRDQTRIALIGARLALRGASPNDPSNETALIPDRRIRVTRVAGPAWIGAFNGRLRDELLNGSTLDGRLEAQALEKFFKSI
jgi:hypothetical protein